MIEYTVKQIAEGLGLSKPTVQKVINQLNISPDRVENNNRRYYSYDNTMRVIKAAKPDFDTSAFTYFSEKPQNQFCEKSTNKPQETENQTAKLPNRPQTAKNEEFELLKDMYETLKRQLEEKDKQLSIKDQQIKDLSDRLAESLQLTKGQQYIHAIDSIDKQQEEIKTAASDRSEESEHNIVETGKKTEKKKTKRFWKKYFWK